MTDVSAETPYAPGAVQPASETSAPDDRRTGGDGGGEGRHGRFRLPGPGRWIAGVFGALVLLLIIFIMLFDWNWLRGPIAHFASKKIHREVRINGNLRVHLLTWTPTVRVEGITVGQPDWAPKGHMLEVESFTASVKLMPLFIGHIDVPLVDIEKPNVVLIQNAKGQANWDFSTPDEKKKPSKPLKLPPIQQFVIADGHLSANIAPRKLAFSGTINSTERNTGTNAETFHLGGDGTLNGRAFQMRVAGGPLINIHRDQPYPFDARVSAGSTVITAKGDIPHPFDFGRVGASVSIQGEDLNNLYYLTGLALPNTPPYRVAGRLTREGKLYRFNGFSGRVGTSDLEGNLSVDTAPKRPFLKAALHSRLLDFKDLASLFGAPGASKAATPEQKAATRAQTAGGGRILPDATLQTERMRIMDADVTYKASAVNAPNLPLRAVSLGVKLDDGLLTLNPIALTFPQGSLNGNAQLNARPATPVTNVDLRLSNVRMEQFIPTSKGAQPPLDGTLQARAKLRGVGNSVHKAASTADGQFTAVIPGGHIREAFAELLGVNAAKGLIQLLGKNKDETPLRCAVADFNVQNGVLQARHIVVDTTVVVVNGTGNINLGDESLNLTLEGKSTKFRVGHLNLPITIGGHLKSPTFGVKPGSAIAQGGVAAVLGAAVNPLLAILPFVDLGTAKNADCAGLYQEARTSPAAVAPKAAPPAKARTTVRRAHH